VCGSTSTTHALIVATALVQGMTVVSRNFAEWQPTGVAVFYPWA